MKKLLSLAVLQAATVMTLTAQTTVTFKPGPALGEDACIGHNTTCNWVNNTGGTQTELVSSKWTYTGLNCGVGTIRSMVRFSQLSSIPAGATITSATLKLYGVPTSMSPSNTGYPGSPYSTDNNVVLSRITSGWDEATVTWNTAPTTTTANQIITPASTTQWNWNYSNSSSDLLSMVQLWVANPAQNFGLMMNLQNENYYRSMLFASSDHVDSTLWPELIVTYTEPCNPHFTFSSSSLSNAIFTFSSPVNQPNTGHYWTYSGPSGSGSMGTTPSVNYTFTQAGSYFVCHTLATQSGSCRACIEVCTNGKLGELAAEKAAGKGLSVTVAQPSPMTAAPNPTSNNWNVQFNSENEGRVRAIVIDMQNKVVFDKMVMVQKGDNSLSIEGSSLAAGQYILTLPLNGSNQTVKLIKN